MSLKMNCEGWTKKCNNYYQKRLMHKYTSGPYTRAATHTHAAIFLENLFSAFFNCFPKNFGHDCEPPPEARGSTCRGARNLQSRPPDAITTRRGLRKGKKWNLATLLLNSVFTLTFTSSSRHFLQSFLFCKIVLFFWPMQISISNSTHLANH